MSPADHDDPRGHARGVDRRQQALVGDAAPRRPRARDRRRTSAGSSSGEPFTVEYRHDRARRPRRCGSRTARSCCRDADGQPRVHPRRDARHHRAREAEERLAYLAYHDNLTGLPNKAMFDELLELSLARARRHDRGVAVLALDVDNFKLVNDSLGHEAGDRLIVQLADGLHEATRDTDLVARQGGDEFLLLLADLDQASPVQRRRRRRDRRRGRRPPRAAMRFAAPVRGRRHRALRDGLDRDQRVPAGRRRRRRACSATPTRRCSGPRRRAPAASCSTTWRTTARSRSSRSSTRLRKAVEQQDWHAALPAARRPVTRRDVRRRGADPLARSRAAASSRRATSSRSPRRWG